MSLRHHAVSCRGGWSGAAGLIGLVACCLEGKGDACVEIGAALAGLCKGRGEVGGRAVREGLVVVSSLVMPPAPRRRRRDECVIVLSRSVRNIICNISLAFLPIRQPRTRGSWRCAIGWLRRISTCWNRDKVLTLDVREQVQSGMVEGGLGREGLAEAVSRHAEAGWGKGIRELAMLSMQA